jgi:hypothetical protein
VTVLCVARLERSFRRAAGLDIDKKELRRHGDFVHRKNYDLLVRGEANGRDVIEPNDLPVTNGLQESIHASRKIDDQELALEPILQAAKWRGSPPKGGHPGSAPHPGRETSAQATIEEEERDWRGSCHRRVAPTKAPRV